MQFMNSTHTNSVLGGESIALNSQCTATTADLLDVVDDWLAKERSVKAKTDVQSARQGASTAETANGHGMNFIIPEHIPVPCTGAPVEHNPIVVSLRKRKRPQRSSVICAHNHLKYTCKECPGSGICEHGNIKYVCIPCGGSRICKHLKLKEMCSECDGKYLCPLHGKSKYYCGGCKKIERQREKSKK